MYFNLIMNAVDAMGGRKVGVIHVGSRVEGDRLVLRVSDTGSGMPPEKIEQLLAEKESLDGELHSLGFVFVRQTVAEFGGHPGDRQRGGQGDDGDRPLPLPARRGAPPRQLSRCEKYGQTEEDDHGHVGQRPREAGARPKPTAPPEGEGSLGRARSSRTTGRPSRPTRGASSPSP